MNLRLFSYKIFFIIGLLYGVNKSAAQTNTSIKLSDKLTQLEIKHNVVFSYNHTLFDTIFLKNDFHCESISECIALIQKRVPVKFTSSSNNNYMVVPERKTINFKIFDYETNKSLPSIAYKINNQELQNLYAENDNFTLEDVFPLDSIHMHSYFHKSIHVQAKDLLKIKRLRLHKKQFYLSQIILKSYLARGIDAKISDQSLQINTQSLGLLAGETDGDVFNVLHSIPGIHSPSGKSGNLNFRGNTYDQNLIQIDDIPIYHSGHFFGAISPYNTSVITNVKVQRNMLPAKFGGRVGGLINMTTSNKIPDSTKYEVAINTLFAGATIKTKLIEDKLSFIAAFRKSYPGFKTPKLEAISTLIFQGSRLESVAEQVNSTDGFDMGFLDINAKLNYKINDKHSASLSFIDIQNHLSAEIKDNQNSNQTDFRDLDLDNWGITGKWEASFSDKLSTELRFSKSSMDLISVSEGFLLTERSSLEKFDNTISDTRLIAEATYSFNPNLTIDAGYNLTNHQLTSNEVEQENNIDSKRDQKATIHSSYVSLQKSWNDKLDINFGFHNNYYAPLKKMHVNPRLNLSYAVNDRLYLKSSIGTSNQFIQKKFTNDFDDFNITNQLWYLPNNTIKPLIGAQAMIGAILNKDKWLIDLELYRKKTNNITNKFDDTHGSLYSIGSNIFIKKRWHKLETWVSYALSKTETDFNNTKTDAFFDQRHIVNLTGILNLNKWKFAISWGYFSGMPIIYPDEIDNNNLDAIFSDRFDALHQLDFSSSYAFYNLSNSVKTVIGLSILNVYDQDNTVNVFQNTSESTFRKASGFSPNLQVNLFF